MRLHSISKRPDRALTDIVCYICPCDIPSSVMTIRVLMRMQLAMLRHWHVGSLLLSGLSSSLMLQYILFLLALRGFWQQYQTCDWPRDVCIIAAPSRKKEGVWGRGREMCSGAQMRPQIVFCTHLVLI